CFTFRVPFADSDCVGSKCKLLIHQLSLRHKTKTNMGTDRITNEEGRRLSWTTIVRTLLRKRKDENESTWRNSTSYSMDPERTSQLLGHYRTSESDYVIIRAIVEMESFDDFYSHFHDLTTLFLCQKMPEK
ncbi:unnamed protein product, partial [Ceratitis capitata]